MKSPYKVMIFLRATGHLMNADAKTVFLSSPTEEKAFPCHYFDSLAEAEQFAWQLHQAEPSVEMSLYLGDDYLLSIPPGYYGSLLKISSRPVTLSFFDRLLNRFYSLIEPFT